MGKVSVLSLFTGRWRHEQLGVDHPCSPEQQIPSWEQELLWSVLELKANFATAKILCFWNRNHLFSVDALILMNCGLFFPIADIPWEGTDVTQCQHKAVRGNFRGTPHCIFTASKVKEYGSYCSHPTSFQGGIVP